VVIDHCTIRHNQFGIAAVTNASYSLTNSLVTENANTGVQLGFSSSATIGVTQNGTPGPNTISNNGASGIQIVGGSFAAIDNNIITGNGTNQNSDAFGLDGVALFEAGANIGGGNTISKNGVFGIELRDSKAIIGKGNAEPNTGATDVISGNGNNPVFGRGQGAGIFASASTILVTGETITNNIGSGIVLAVGSNMKMDGEVPGAKLTITGNTVDGIQVSQGSRLLLNQDALAVQVSGNAGFDLDCLGAKAAAGGTFTGVVKISPTCTGF
jgi:parallel beta-helix repeat protein